MTKMDRLGISVCLSLFLTLALSGPVARPSSTLLTCSRHCRVPKDSKFRYLSDQVYDYRYEVETSSHPSPSLTPSPSAHHAARIVVHALAQVHVLSTCDMLLKLREVHITETDPNTGTLRKSDNSKNFRKELERESLRFAFLDGQISNVCPSGDETVWALNIKRGFLSALQNGMKKLDKEQTVVEGTVLGRCLTHYSLATEGWFSKKAKLSRDLNNCSNTQQQEPSSRVLASLLTGSQDCEQTIDWNGIIISATCVEQRHFRPVPVKTTGLVTVVSQSIKFIEKRDRGRFTPPMYKRADLEYDPRPQPDEEGDSERALRTVREVLRQLCAHAHVTPATTDLFFALVSNVRRLSAPRLRLLYEKVSGASLCSSHVRVRKFFVDALAAAGTDSSVRQLTKALISQSKGDALDSVSTRLLLTALSFLPRPSSAMLSAARSLLEDASLASLAALPVSGMVNRHCRSHADCASDANVQRIVTHFRQLVGTQCLANTRSTDTVLLALRAIGNAGHVVRSTEVLDNCLRRTNNPLDVRVAAADAFRRMPCSASRDRVQAVFEDASEPSELRIASYLTVIQCANASQLARLQHTLAAETDAQVASFVFTHLTNLERSGAGPLRKEIEALLRNVDFASKDIGRLLLSRNFAGQALSSPVHVTSNLVWPSSSSSSSSLPFSSWVPRSLTAHFATTFLGEEVDLAEIGVRGEGLDYVIDNVLLPLLGKRRPHAGPRKREEDLKKLKSWLFARIGGNEIAFLQPTGSFLKHLDSGAFFNSKALLSKMFAEGETVFSQNLVLLDQRLTVPTCGGLPLTVTVNGSLSALLNVSGSVDLRHALARPRAVKVQGAIQPSVAIKVAATMSVDAVVTRSALRMTGTVHSSTVLQGLLQLDRGKLFHWEMNVPRNKMTLLDARSELSFVYKNKEYPLNVTRDEGRDLTACTGSTGVRLFGLDLCADLRLPQSAAVPGASLYDLALSPSSVSVVLHKRDRFDRYKILAQHSQTKHSVSSHLYAGTPGPGADRTLEVKLDVNTRQRKLDLKMRSPWSKVQLEGAVTNSVKHKMARCVLTLDDDVTYGVIAEVKQLKSNEGLTFRPTLEIRHLRGGPPLSLSGSVTVARYWRALSFDLSLDGVTSISPNIKGTLTNSKREISVRMAASLGPKGSYSMACGSFVTVTGKVATKTELSPFLYINTPTAQLVSLSGRGDYRRDKLLRADVKLLTDWTEPFTIQYAMVKTPSRGLIHYRLDAKVRSAVALVSVDARADVRAGQMMWTRLTLNHDIPELMAKDTISLATKLASRRAGKLWNGVLQTKFDSHAHSAHSFEVKASAEGRSSQSRVNLWYGRGLKAKLTRNYVDLRVKARHEVVSLYRLGLATSATLDIPQENVHLEVKASHKHSAAELDSKAALTYGDNQQAQARLILLNKSSRFLRVVGKALVHLPQAPGRIRRGAGPAKGKKGGKAPYVHLSMRLNESEDEYDVKTGAQLGRKKRAFSAHWNIKKPVSLRRVQMYCKGHPYSRGKKQQEFEAEFSHSMHPLLADVLEEVFTRPWDDLDVEKRLRLLTSVAGTEMLMMNGSETSSQGPPHDVVKTDLASVRPDDLDSSFDDDDDDLRRARLRTGGAAADSAGVVDPVVDVKGGLDIKSTFFDLVSGSLTLAHSHDADTRSTEVSLIQNGAAGLSARVSVKHNLTQENDVTVELAWPQRELTAGWQYQQDGSKIRSTLLSTWPKDRRLYVDLSGQLDRSGLTRTEGFSADVVVESPWRPLRDWRGSVATDYSPGGMFRSKSLLRRRGVKVTSHNVMVVRTSSLTDASVTLFTPWTKKVSASLVLAARRDHLHGDVIVYPVTGTAQLTWNPRDRIVLTSSANLEAWDDAAVSLRVKTTAPDWKLVSVEASNRALGAEDLMSRVTAKLGSANRAFSAQSVLRRRDWGKLRLRVLTPFQNFRVLESGYQVDSSGGGGGGDGLRSFAYSADFRVFPLVKRYDVSLAWTYAAELRGKLHLTTPLRGWPNVQVSARSETRGRERQWKAVLRLQDQPPLYALSVRHAADGPDRVSVGHALEGTAATPGSPTPRHSGYHNQGPDRVSITLETPHHGYETITVLVQRDRTGLEGSRIFLNVSVPGCNNTVTVLMEREATGQEGSKMFLNVSLPGDRHVTVVCNVDTENEGGVRGRVALVTPFRDLLTANASFVLVTRSDREILTDVNVTTSGNVGGTATTSDARVTLVFDSDVSHHGRQDTSFVEDNDNHGDTNKHGNTTTTNASDDNDTRRDTAAVTDSDMHGDSVSVSDEASYFHGDTSSVSDNDKQRQDRYSWMYFGFFSDKDSQGDSTSASDNDTRRDNSSSSDNDTHRDVDTSAKTNRFLNGAGLDYMTARMRALRKVRLSFNHGKETSVQLVDDYGRDVLKDHGIDTSFPSVDVDVGGVLRDHTRVVATLDRSPDTLTVAINTKLPFADDFRMLSNYSRSPQRVLAEFSTAHGDDLLLRGDVAVTLSQVRTGLNEGVYGRKEARMTSQTATTTYYASSMRTASTQSFPEGEGTSRTSETAALRDPEDASPETETSFVVSGVTVSVETKLPLLDFRRFGLHASIQQTNDSDFRSENHLAENSKGKESGKSVQSIDIVGWARRSDLPQCEPRVENTARSGHANVQIARSETARVKTVYPETAHVKTVYSETARCEADSDRLSLSVRHEVQRHEVLRHEVQRNTRATSLHLTARLNHTEPLSIHIASSGALHNATAAAQINVSKSQVFAAKIRHLDHADRWHSSISFDNALVKNVSGLMTYARDTHNLTVEASVAVDGSFDARASLENVTDIRGINTMAAALGVESSWTGRVRGLTEMSTSPDDLGTRVAARVDAHNSFVSVNGTHGEEISVDISACGGCVVAETKTALTTTGASPPQIELTYRGTSSDFQSSFLVDGAYTGLVEGVVEIRLVSLHDARARLALKTPIRHARDLSLLLQSDTTRGDNHALLALGWAPYRVISLDAYSKHLPSLVGLSHQTDVVLVTPFRDFQTGSLKVRYERILAKTDRFLEATVNGQVVLDASLTSNEPSSLGLSRRLMSFFQRSALAYVSRQTSHRAGVLLRWSLARPERHVRVLANVTATGMDGAANQERHFSVEAQHPARVCAAQYSTKRAAAMSSGQGKVSWRRRNTDDDDEEEEDDSSDDDHKVYYYAYSTVHTESFPADIYQTHVKIGTPVRSLEANSTVSRSTRSGSAAEYDDAALMTSSGASRLMTSSGAAPRVGTVVRVSADGSLLWDADRDRSKGVTLTSVVTRRDTTLSADVALDIPALSQGVHVTGEVTLPTASTVWNVSACLRPSQDPARALSFSSVLLRATPSSGLAMATTLTQPSSDLDLGLTFSSSYPSYSPSPLLLLNTPSDSSVTEATTLTQPSSDPDLLGLTSSLGGDESFYTATLEGWYVTSRRERRTLVLTSVVDLALKNINTTVRTDRAEHSVAAEYVTSKPFTLRLQGHSLDLEKKVKDRRRSLHVVLDPFHRSLVASYRPSADQPDLSVVEAWYVNDSAIRFEAYRKHVTGSVTDAVLDLNLNSSTLLHAGLSWRPEITRELASRWGALWPRLNDLPLQAHLAAVHRAEVVLTEVAAKHASLMTSILHDLTPVLGPLGREVGAVGREVGEALAAVSTLWSDNAELLELLEFLVQPVNTTAHLIADHIQDLSTKYSQSYSETHEWILRRYNHAIDQLFRKIAVLEAEGTEKLQELSALTDLYLRIVRDRLDEVSNTISSVGGADSYLDETRGRLSYLRMRGNGQLIPEESELQAWLSPLRSTNSSILMVLASTATELYSQGTWAYHHLHLHPHLPSPSHSALAASLRDVILAEIRFRLRHFRFLQRSRVTLWRPEEGEIRGEVALPFPLKSLTSL